MFRYNISSKPLNARVKILLLILAFECESRERSLANLGKCLLRWDLYIFADRLYF
jgi:hypothetical protein